MGEWVLNVTLYVCVCIYIYIYILGSNLFVVFNPCSSLPRCPKETHVENSMPVLGGGLGDQTNPAF